MGIRYVIALNIDRPTADRIDGLTVGGNIRGQLIQAGYRVSDTPRYQENAIDGGFADSITGPRAVVVVGLSIDNRDTLSVAETHTVDSICVTALALSARAGWSVNAIIAALPAQGNGEGRVSYNPRAGVTSVKREVAQGTGTPGVSVTNPVSPTVVVQTTDPNQHVGQVNPSEVQLGGNALASYLSEYKLPLTIGVGVIGLGFIAYTVKTLKG